MFSNMPGSRGVLSAVGRTPLVELSRAFKGAPFRVFAKLEGLNPGGSTKDRPALSIIEHALSTGLIDSDTVVVESSSGNMGIGLAQLCSYYGLRFICVIDPKTTAQNINILKVYGAEIDIVEEPDPETGEYLPARIRRVKHLLLNIKNSFWPNQYGNEYNAVAHHQTMHEIVEALGEKLDYLFCATSTCGTIRGCAEYLRAHNMPTRVFAVDAVGSAIFCEQKGKRLIPGHGAAMRPDLYQPGLAERCIHVSDADCVIGCRRLVSTEAILAGGSSGAVLMAVEYVKNEIAIGSNCVLIFPDRGERYMDTIYSDAWVAERIGDIAHMWQQPAHAISAAAASADEALPHETAQPAASVSLF
jgi:N-(2-amino-2-carboxyethyl)-L-glutamate synthase